MMNGGDLYEMAKILGHSNIKMTERYAKLGRKHITRASNTGSHPARAWFSRGCRFAVCFLSVTVPIARFGLRDARM